MNGGDYRASERASESSRVDGQDSQDSETETNNEIKKQGGKETGGGLKRESDAGVGGNEGKRRSRIHACNMRHDIPCENSSTVITTLYSINLKLFVKCKINC